jgi:hypothetical protein
MEKLSKLIKILGYLDYAVSVAVLAYGVYVQSWLYTAVGVFGLVVAYLQPAERVKALLLKKFVRKSTPEVIQDSLDVHQSRSVLFFNPASYAPRRRYPRVAYFVGYEIDRPSPRMQVVNAQNYEELLRVPSDRFKPGIRATEIIPR